MLNFRWIGAAALVLAMARVGMAQAQPYKAPLGPMVVATLEADWHDGARDVTVPVKIYYPKDLAQQKTALPVIVFSHGLGGSREGYEPYGEHWASYGYIVILPTHVGSDTGVVTSAITGGAGAQAAVQNLVGAANAQNAARRVKDVSFVLDQIDKANAGTLADKSLAVFKDKVDMKHVGMSGHSFGAETTMVVAGETLALAGIKRGGADPRVTAAIAMSPQGAVVGDQKAAFAGVKIPVLHLTGTADDSPPLLGNVKAIDRRIPYDNSPDPDTYLVIFKGATHMTFAPDKAGNTPGTRLRELLSGRGRGAESQPAISAADEAVVHTLVLESTTAFWDAYLKNDAAAKTWLNGDFAKVMGAAGTFETKHK